MKALGHFISTTVHHYHYKHLHYCLDRQSAHCQAGDPSCILLSLES